MILSRKGKLLNTKNWVQIPEVSSYCYLGVRVTQSLKLNEHEMKHKQVEKALIIKIGILKPSLVNTKSRFIIYKTVIKSKFFYTATTICMHNYRYISKIEAILYRCIKSLFCIRSNIKKKIFNVLGIPNVQETIRELTLSIKEKNSKLAAIY